MTTVSPVHVPRRADPIPSDTIVMAAQAMEELDVGAIPVCDGDKLVGMVTDRDIAVRAVARSLDGSTKLSEVMSGNGRCGTEDQSVEQLLAAMAQAQIRRMPMVDGKRKRVGVVSIGDIAAKDCNDKTGVAESLGDISAQTAPDATADPLLRRGRMVLFNSRTCVVLHRHFTQRCLHWEPERNRRAHVCRHPTKRRDAAHGGAG